ncbi:hypothetical protein VTI28DRAFT_7771 [Corynascus sepedonium]
MDIAPESEIQTPIDGLSSPDSTQPNTPSRYREYRRSDIRSAAGHQADILYVLNAASRRLLRDGDRTVEQFYPFGKLPPELRLMIWKMSFQPRLVEVKVKIAGVYVRAQAEIVHKTTRNPVQLAISRESRECAKSSYRKLCFTIEAVAVVVYLHPNIDVLRQDFAAVAGHRAIVPHQPAGLNRLLKNKALLEFGEYTGCLDAGREGISMEALNEYLNKHVDKDFERFVDKHFEGTPFNTDIFKTAHRFYTKQKLPVIRKALKLIVAYNLTLHITMVKQPQTEEPIEGHIKDKGSKYYGKVVAPAMINFRIKSAMAGLWRELQEDILEELSVLYSSHGERMNNWFTIFLLSFVLLAVWEEIQFDCHYRVPDQVTVEKFCDDMEMGPVRAIVSHFHVISQNLAPFTEWDTQWPGQLLNNDPAVYEAMTQVQKYVVKHEAYLRTRSGSEFDPNDFDSLSNKLLSKLVFWPN